MAPPEVKKEDKVATRKIAEGSDLSTAALVLNKLFDTIRNSDQKENRFLAKHIDGESSEYTLIQDNNINMLNILSSQSITESLLGTMRDTVGAGTTSSATMVSSPRVLQQTRQEPRQDSNERARERQRVVPSTPVTSAGSIDNRSVPRVVSESVKKIDSYVSTQSGETKFSELKTINEETGEALERSASLLSNINESVQRQNRLLEETIENLKRQLEETSSDDDNLPDINIDLDLDRRRNRGSRPGQRPSTGSRPQARGSVPQVRPSVTPSVTPETPRTPAAPSRPNVVGGIVSGLIAGAATESATSYLTGKDEGLSAALLGLSPVATGVVGAAAGIKGAFELAENLTPEERKGAIDPLKKAELAIAEKIKIKFIKNIEPFKAGDVVDAKKIIQEFEVADNEKVEFFKQLFDTKQIDVATEASTTAATPAPQVLSTSAAALQTSITTVEGTWSFNEFRKKDPESADKYVFALKEESKRISDELKKTRIKPNMNPATVADELQYIKEQAKILAEANILPLFADSINKSGAGNLKVNNIQATPTPQVPASANVTPVPQVNTTSVSATPQATPVSITSTPVPQAGLTPQVPASANVTPVPQVNTTSVSATPQATPVSITSTPVPQAGLTPQVPASANVTPVSSNVIPQQDYSSFVSASSTAMNVIQFLQQNQTASVSTPSPARPSVSSIISQPASQQTVSQIITPSDSNTIEEKIKKTLSEYNDLLIKLDENDKLSDKIASKKITTEKQISFEKRRSADTQTLGILAKLESDLKYYETIDQKRKILQKNIIEEYSSARDEYSNVRRILNNARGVSTNDIQKQAEEVFSKRNQTDETKLKEFNKQYSDLEKELEKEPPKDFAIVDTTGENAGITPIPSITETPVISPVPSTPVSTPVSAQLLAASTPSVNKEYVVKRGDTLSGIAKSNNLKLEDILKANPQIKNPNDIKLGQTIKIADASNVNDKFNKILSKYKEFFDKINSNSKLNDDISKKVVHYETNIRNEKRKNDAVSNQIITKLEFNLKYYNTLNVKRIELEKRVNNSYTRAIDEYSNIRRMLQTIETYRENNKREANKEIESKFKEQEKIDLDNLKQFESEYENLVKLLNSEPKEIETTAQPERRGDDATPIASDINKEIETTAQPERRGDDATSVNDAEPVDKDLLSPVSQTYMDDTTDTGWQEAESTDTGWQEAGSEPTSRPMARPTRTRRQTSGDTSDSLTITARDIVFKSDKMEAPFLDAIKEELSDFMNTIMNVSGQGAAVTSNLAGGGMSSSGGLASPVSFANVSGGMRPAAMSSFDSGSDTSTQQGQDQSQSQGGTSEKPENVTIDSGVDISKVDKDLLSGFYAAAKDYGKPVKINSGFRGDEKQAELWVRANVFKEPGIYMPAKPDKPTTINYKGQTFNVPGGSTKSSHGGSSSSARALDVTRGALEEMDSMGLLRKYGLHRPFPNDPVHVERIGSRSAPPDTSSDGAQQASQVSATPATAVASSEGGQQAESGGETATPVASEASGGEAMASGASGAAESGASMTPSTPSSGPTVATASVENEVAKRTPMSPSAPTAETPSSGSSSPGVGDTSYPISMGDPGNVEPPDAAQRYALLFDMAA